MLVSPSRLGCRPGIEGLDSGDDLLRWDPLEGQQPPPVSADPGRKANRDDVDGAQLQFLAAQGSSSGWSAVLRGMPVTVGSSAVSRPSVTACRGLTRSLCLRGRLALCWPSECPSEGRAHDYMGRAPSASTKDGQTTASRGVSERVPGRAARLVLVLSEASRRLR